MALTRPVACRQTGALLLDGNTLNYFGKNIPINLVVAVIAEIVLVGGAEYYRIINGLVRFVLALLFLRPQANIDRSKDLVFFL